MWLTHLRLQRCTETTSICVRKSGRHVENPRPSSEEISSPLSKTVRDVSRPLSVKHLLRQWLVNKWLGLDAQNPKKYTIKKKSVTQCLLCSKLKRVQQKNCKSGTITQQQTRQEQCYALFELQVIHSASHPMNNVRQACIVLPSRRLFLWIGGKLLKRPVQIRHDGFIICLKCQLLQKPFPRLHSQIEALNFQLFLPNHSNHRSVKH